jgi:hypothetical protein
MLVGVSLPIIVVALGLSALPLLIPPMFHLQSHKQLVCADTLQLFVLLAGFVPLKL